MCVLCERVKCIERMSELKMKIKKIANCLFPYKEIICLYLGAVIETRPTFVWLSKRENAIFIMQFKNGKENAKEKHIISLNCHNSSSAFVFLKYYEISLQRSFCSVVLDFNLSFTCFFEWCKWINKAQEKYKSVKWNNNQDIKLDFPLIENPLYSS